MQSRTCEWLQRLHRSTADQEVPARPVHNMVEEKSRQDWSKEEK
jgi:hypothetical protein